MKKLLSLIICVLLTLSLTLIMTGCGNKEEGNLENQLVDDKDDYDPDYDDENNEDDDEKYSSDSKRIVGEWVLEIDLSVMNDISESLPNLGDIYVETIIEFKKSGEYQMIYNWDSMRNASDEMLLRILEDQNTSVEEFEEKIGMDFEEFLDNYLETAASAIEKKEFLNGEYELSGGYLIMSDGVFRNDDDDEPDEYEYKFKGDDTLIIYLGGNSKIEKFTLKRD